MLDNQMQDLPEIPAPPLGPGEPVKATTTGTTINSVGGWNLHNPTPGSTMRIMMPRPQSDLYVTPQFRISHTQPMPNAWIRFWQYFLLGWKWRKL